MKGLKKAAGIGLLVAGSFALIAPQANLGLTELRWLARYAFPGEALVGALLVGVGYFLLGRAAKAGAGEGSSGPKQ